MGSGGSGHVYLVKNRTNEQQYAIKKVLSGAQTLDHADSRQRIQRHRYARSFSLFPAKSSQYCQILRCKLHYHINPRHGSKISVSIMQAVMGAKMKLLASRNSLKLPKNTRAARSYFCGTLARRAKKAMKMKTITIPNQKKINNRKKMPRLVKLFLCCICKWSIAKEQH